MVPRFIHFLGWFCSIGWFAYIFLFRQNSQQDYDDIFWGVIAGVGLAIVIILGTRWIRKKQMMDELTNEFFRDLERKRRLEETGE